MCGIVGYVGDRSASEILVDGLKRLEYRGYDSSGIAILNGGAIQLRRAVGKLANLELVLKRKPLSGSVGVGHTRWATHGIPSEENAHPHSDCSKRIVVVHNGIIENYSELKAHLLKKGHRFSSQTDTEIIAHLIEDQWNAAQKKAKTLSPEKKEKLFEEVVRKSLLMLKGAFALGVVCAEFPDLLIAGRKDCPLVIGLGKHENFIASDVPALIQHTRNTIFLDQQEMAVIRKEGVECFSLDGQKKKKEPVTIVWDPVQAEKAGYKHFMMKEIMEQPIAIENTLRGRLHSGAGLQLDITLKKPFIDQMEKIVLIACGTSYHAALIGRFWLESIAKIPCQVEIASEFRYRDCFLGEKHLAILISQSGETADTLAALHMVKQRKVKTLAICNVLGATMTREADTTFYTHCGPEIGVASTKALTGQLVALLLIAIYFGRLRQSLPPKQYQEMLKHLAKLPGWTRETLELSGKIESISRKFYQKNHFLYLGRNLNYPVALEGALKLKEISYIHAEGYPAGELKHGPIALIDKEMPVVALATESGVYEKILSNIQEVKARGGIVIAVASKGGRDLKGKAEEIISVPKVPEIFSPIINAIPLQLLAYHIAVLKGCDIDQPRNLAKSVTVE